jgi:outer membrane protein assembly factor BamB
MLTRRDALKLTAVGLVIPSSAIAQSVPGTPEPGGTPQPGASPVPMATPEAGASGVSMFRGNAARTGELPGPVPTMDKPIIIKWRFSTGSSIYSSPAVVGGIVYVGSDDDSLYAIDAATGAERWRFSTGGDVDSSAAVVDGTVYVGSYDGNIYAIDAASGEERWRFDTNEDGRRLVPAVLYGMVYVGGTNLYALDAASGEERWRFSASDSLSAPAVADGMVFAAGQSLYAIDAASGEERWRFSNEGYGFGVPVVADANVYAGSYDGYTYAIDAVTGEERWRFATGVTESPAVAHGMVFASTLQTGDASLRPAVFALDATSGSELWRFAPGAGFDSTPLYVDGTVFVYADDQNLYAIDATSGAEQWRLPVTLSFNYSAVPAVIDNTLYFGTFDGDVYAIHNLQPSVLATDVTLRGAPSSGGVERGTASAGDEVSNIGSREERNGIVWMEVTIGQVTGWIPAEAIDPATLPPENYIDLRYWMESGS